jgi:hypothetical protein
MRRQLLRTLLWLLLLPVAGSVRLFSVVVYLAGRLRLKSLITLGGLVLVLSARSPLTAQLPLDRGWPREGHSILFGGVVVLVLIVLVLGARSPVCQRLWRRLRW